MEIICYGCGRGEHPENTIKAIAHCQKTNPEWRIDLDLQLTKDKQLVLFHDYNTLRRTGENHNIYDLDLSEVKKLNAGHYFKENENYPYRNNPVQVPTLDEVFSRFSNANFVLDVHSNNPIAIDKTIAVVEKYNMDKQVVIVSHYDSVIKTFKTLKPHWRFGAATTEAKRLVFSSMFFLDFLFPLKSNYLFIPIQFKGITLLRKNINRHIKKHNKKIIVWGQEGKTNDDVICIETKEHYLKLKQLGIDGVYTEYPEWFSETIV